MARRAVGRIERSTAEFVRELHAEGDLTAAAVPLSKVALELARTLDAGAGLATAAVARELRATLAGLAPKGGEPGDDDLFSRLERELSSPMGDDPQP